MAIIPWQSGYIDTNTGAKYPTLQQAQAAQTTQKTTNPAAQPAAPASTPNSASPSFTLASAKTFASNPSSIPIQTGNVQKISDALNTLKQGVQSGQLSITEYMPLVSGLVKQAQTVHDAFGNKGQSAASQVDPAWTQIQQNGFAQASAGKWVPQSGFSTTEYAQLPNNVLPTQKDLQSGIISPTSVPLQRTQTEPGQPSSPAQPAAPPNVTPIPTSPNVKPTVPDSNGQPLPQVNTALPNTIDTTTDQGKASIQGQQNAQQLQDVLNKQYGVNTQAVDQLASGISGIPGIYKQEGQSEQNQLNALADQQKASRSQALQDLATTLATNQQNLFNRSIPNLAEQANTSGVYRSTGFGDILANKYANLTADTQNQLALQGLSDRDTYLAAQQNALGTGLGYSGQAAQAAAQGQQTVASAASGALGAYGAGLGDVANAQIGMQNAGLQRQFSLQDYATQYANALNLANASKTQGPSGKASPGTQAGIQTGLGIANTATQAYGAAKPYGK